MIKSVIRTQEDMVLVFNEKDRQIPEYQGLYKDVRQKILRNAVAGTVFKHWLESSPEPRIVPQNNW